MSEKTPSEETIDMWVGKGFMEKGGGAGERPDFGGRGA